MNRRQTEWPALYPIGDERRMTSWLRTSSDHDCFVGSLYRDVKKAVAKSLDIAASVAIDRHGAAGDPWGSLCAVLLRRNATRGGAVRSIMHTIRIVRGNRYEAAGSLSEASHRRLDSAADCGCAYRRRRGRLCLWGCHPVLRVCRLAK